MYRFFALTWDRRNDHAAQEAKRLMRKLEEHLPSAKASLSVPGLVVYTACDSPGSFDVYPGHGAPVLVVGKLFHREMNEEELPRPVVLAEPTTRAVLETRGRTLVERFWGGYVAFIHDEPSATTFVVRDPTGDLPCYVTSVEGLSLIFSCMEDCIALGVRRFSTNWQYVSAFLLRPYIDVRDTGLNEVVRVAAGECMELLGGVERRRHYYWNLVDMAADQPIEDVEFAVREARKTLLACVGTWAADHPQIMHHLSGGLDSSITLAALMRAPSRPDVTCIHQFDKYAVADERRFARMAVEGATASGGTCRLLECERSPAGFNLDKLTAFPRTACPARYVGYLSQRYLGPDTTPNGRAIQFTGSGGDGTFVRMNGDAAAIDYVWRHGLGRHLPRIALEAAQQRGTFWGVLAHAIRERFLRSKGYNLGKRWHMIDPGVLDALRGDTDQRLVPAWLKATPTAHRRLSPEKLQQLDVMTLSWKTVDPFERVGNWEWFAPIASQPVIELFARIPIYVLMHGAQDRAIARRAFAPYLPAGLLTRRTKSYMDDIYLEMTRHHASFLREMFLDGILVKERILDRRKVEDTLARLHIDSDNILPRLTGPQLNMEAWLRNWQHPSQLAATATAA